MALDDQVRKHGDALATELGHDIKQAFGRFLDDVLTQVVRDQDATQVQHDQALAESDARLEAAVTQARADAGADKDEALAAAAASAKDETAAAVQAAIAQTREHVAREAASLVARAREEAAQANASVAADRETRKAAEESRQAAEASRRAAEDEAAALKASAEQGSLAAMERLLEAFRKLDQSTTLTALIDTLAEAAAGETTRSAVFVVRGRDVRGWRVAGFANAPADVRLVSLPLDAAGGLGDSVRTRTRTEVDPTAFASMGDLAFMAATADAALGMAMPVTVGGETAAIIYGDDNGAGGPAGWRETIEILARHAARCLEAQTAIRAARLAPGKPEPVGAER